MILSSTMSNAYDFAANDKKWQDTWLQTKLYSTKNNSDKKRYILDMFPYPSGEGLHVGHPLGYIATDILARQSRMLGYDVLHPMGWDAFGLPAENYAIKTGTHPAVTTEKNINRYREQLKRIGFSYDWDREVNTTDPSYYKWTQWIFLQLFHRGLAYESSLPINWCPSCKTGLANEEVVNGNQCDRCGSTVEQKAIRQWVLKITEYAERLLIDLDDLDWPEHIKEMQRNWIGKSTGTEVFWNIKDKADIHISTYTTRVDTLFGTTFIVIAPEHEALQDIITADQADEVRAYVQQALQKSNLERTELAKEKTGVFTGAYAIHPFTGESHPIFVGDYVLGFYGTGAVVGVPAHDDRDYEFAQLKELPVIGVIAEEGQPTADEHLKERAFTELGVLYNSSEFSGMTSTDAQHAITEALEKTDTGKGTTQYKLRDWIFSRQRYWGEPIPLIHCKSCGVVAVPEKDLPVVLPAVEKYEPTGTGESPLASIEEWVNTTCPTCGGVGKRETNTMPQWGGSCWYYLRYIDPHNETELADKDLLKKWLPVDTYVGGAEHAVLHLLYARFWHKVLYDIGAVPTKEPFQGLRNQGMIQGEDGVKMSKSRGNVINPDDTITRVGADAFRTYEMFMGPFDASKPWSTSGIEGTHRFLQKVWRLQDKLTETGSEDISVLHKTIRSVTEGIDQMSFNTVVSDLMKLTNHLTEQENISITSYKTIITLLAPYAPHMTEELWAILGHKESIHLQPWPAYDASLAASGSIQIAVQVNGKVKGVVEVTLQTSKTDALDMAKALPEVQKYIAAGVRKEIFVPGKIINFVV